MYFIAGRAIREHNDAWLSGEIQVLRQVSLAARPGEGYRQIMEEIAESASREVSVEGREEPRIVFFLQTDASGHELAWLGPGEKSAFTAALARARPEMGHTRSLQVPGWRAAFRVIRERGPQDSEIYLGLSDLHARRVMQSLIWDLALVWLGVVVFGWVVAFLGARHMLKRVEGITRAAARIGSEDLGSRVSEGTRDDEIASLGRTFNTMLGRIAETVTQLRSLTDSVAHELKSPVTSIRGRLEVALSSDRPEGWRDAVALAIEDLDRLSAFITVTLDVAEAEGGALRIPRERVNMTELVSDVVALYEPAFAERRLRIELSLPDAADASVDRALVGRALGNVLDNALRHTGSGSAVSVAMTTDGASLVLTVEDDGPGFPADLEGRMFERFAKGGNSGGHGLGLAFVRA
ncbi:MAG TPA: ATP-binding protein, partial [Candidatus Methylomirabilis sp.]|nr:ATP-binding protein [Candidatus Methylomirabilis sp.]